LRGVVNILYCAFEEGITCIASSIPPPNEHLRYFISWQGNHEKLQTPPDSLLAREDVEIGVLYGKGLSKNRNHAIQMLKSSQSKGAFLIADEDVTFIRNFEMVILNALDEFPHSDLFCFKILCEDSHQQFKSYPKSAVERSIWNIDKVSSIEVAGRVEVLEFIQFDEQLGLGSNFPSGEETAFLADALRAGFKIQFVPEFVVSHPFESSGKMRKNKFDKQSLKLVGGRVYRIYGEPLATFFYAFSTIKNLYKYKSQVGLISYFMHLKAGKRCFKSQQNA
jgi:hypothetical protein